MATIFTCDVNQISAERAKIVDGINARIVWERETKGTSDAGNKIVESMLKQSKAASKLDSMTLAFVHHNPTLVHVTDDESVTITYADIFTSQRRASQCFNLYAIPKVFVVARVLNGSTFYAKGNDDETLAGVILAMASGIMEGKLIKNYLCDFMNAPGKGRGAWQSQDTQGSSSLRALEALQCVRKLDGKGTQWGIANAERFARLVEGAHGIPYSAPLPATLAADAAAISDTTPSDDSEIAALLERLSVDSVPVPASADTASEVSADTASETLALSAPSETLLLVAPVVATPKAKRARKAK